MVIYQHLATTVVSIISITVLNTVNGAGIEWQHSYNESISPSVLLCNNGYIMGGLYINRNNTINKILCVSPSYPSLISQTCYDIDLLLNKSNKTETIQCDSTYFVAGIGAVYDDINYLKCCKYNDTQLVYVVPDNNNVHAIDCFYDNIWDKWCIMDNMEYITGFKQNMNYGMVANLLWIRDRVQSFGVRTRKYLSSTTSATINLTLWFNFVIYKCSIYPLLPSSTYLCDTATFTIIDSAPYCHDVNNSAAETKLLLENALSADSAKFFNIFIKTVNNIVYGIESICVKDGSQPSTMYGYIITSSTECGVGYTHYRNVCIDNELDHCGPPKQLVYFDTTRPNVDITNAIWKDGTKVTMDIFCSIEVESFGVMTTGGTSTATTTLTLWYDFKIYECDIIPEDEDTLYVCDKTSYIIIDSVHCDESQYKYPRLLIDNDDTDSFRLTYVFMKTVNNISYGIEGICMRDGSTDNLYDYYYKTSSAECGNHYSHFDRICVDNQEEDCGPSKQLLYFNINEPNTDITDALWRDGSNVPKSILCETQSEIESFGVRTTSSSSQGVYTLTLWYKSAIYQCTIVPELDYTIYGCYSSSYTIIDTSHCAEPQRNETKLLIEATSDDSAGFSYLFIETKDRISYLIDAICISDAASIGDDYSKWKVSSNSSCSDGYSNYDRVCLDTEAKDCTPAKQVVYFDMNQPNVDIQNALWHDGTNVSASCATNNNTRDVEGIIFGVLVGDNKAFSTVTLTLFFDFKIYECSIIPSQKYERHTCDSSTYTILHNGTGATICDGYEGEAKLLIDNTHSDSVTFTNIFIITNDTYFGINSVCISDLDVINIGIYYVELYNSNTNSTECGDGYTHFTAVCIDEDSSGCNPSKQLVYFDTNKPNVNITNALWRDATDVIIAVDIDQGSGDVIPEIDTFGVTVSHMNNSIDYTVRITLWYNLKVYQCIIIPSSVNATFSCDSSSYTIIDSFNGCGAGSNDTASATDTKILIENREKHSVLFSNIFMRTIHNIWYGIDSICISDAFTELGDGYNDLKMNGSSECDTGYSHYQYVCIGQSMCLPEWQLLYFDPFRPNINITNALWSDASETVTQFGIKTENGCDETVTLTLWYQLVIYQCIIEPLLDDHVYSCNSSTFVTLNQNIDGCINNAANAAETKMIIDTYRINRSFLSDTVSIYLLNGDDTIKEFDALAVLNMIYSVF